MGCVTAKAAGVVLGRDVLSSCSLRPRRSVELPATRRESARDPFNSRAWAGLLPAGGELGRDPTCFRVSGLSLAQGPLFSWQRLCWAAFVRGRLEPFRLSSLWAPEIKTLCDHIEKTIMLGLGRPVCRKNRTVYVERVKCRFCNYYFLMLRIGMLHET